MTFVPPPRPYGSQPLYADNLDFEWYEYMHYLYLPVMMFPEAGSRQVRLPERLWFLRGLCQRILEMEQVWKYMYVTARRGYATPGNPLNRPGWHADGFGTPDLNYIWSDRWSTRFAIGEFVDISEDHVVSAQQFDAQIEGAFISQGLPDDPLEPPIRVIGLPDRTLVRLDPAVVHATPEIPPPGGDRSFFKISLSDDRYNLLGNSHNYLFDYDWRMFSRSEVRNDPAYAGGDSGPQGDQA